MQPKESKSNHHFITSIIKSAVRIMGYGALIYVGNIWITIAAISLIAAEILGIVEEF